MLEARKYTLKPIKIIYTSSLLFTKQNVNTKTIFAILKLKKQIKQCYAGSFYTHFWAMTQIVESIERGQW